MYETGAMRRTHLRGHPNISKRLLIHAAAFNLALVMRKITGSGTPRGMREHLLEVISAYWLLCIVTEAPLKQTIPRLSVRTQ